jgi:hypothetical protein
MMEETEKYPIFTHSNEGRDWRRRPRYIFPKTNISVCRFIYPDIQRLVKSFLALAAFENIPAHILRQIAKEIEDA